MTSPLIEAVARAIDPEIWSDTFLDAGRMNRVRRESLDRAQAALKAISESGCAVRPIHPTNEMKAAGARVCDNSFDLAHECWAQMNRAHDQAMLSALPDTGGE